MTVWVVDVSHEDKRWTLRVPEQELRAYLSTLIYNGLASITLKRELS